MRPSLLLLAAAAATITGSALAAPAPSSESPSASSSAAPADNSASPSANTGTGANTSATAGGFHVGENVQDNTGATIGQITKLDNANGQQVAVIKMGGQSFEVPTDRLGTSSGSATINMTKAQLADMIKAASSGASGSAAPSSGSSSGGSEGASPKP